MHTGKLLNSLNIRDQAISQCAIYPSLVGFLLLRLVFAAIRNLFQKKKLAINQNFQFILFKNLACVHITFRDHIKSCPCACNELCNFSKGFSLFILHVCDSTTTELIIPLEWKEKITESLFAGFSRWIFTQVNRNAVKIQLESTSVRTNAPSFIRFYTTPVELFLKNNTPQHGKK